MLEMPDVLRRAKALLARSVTPGGRGDLFDLMDADNSGNVSAQEILVAFSAFQDCCETDAERSALAAYNVGNLFMFMCMDCGWGDSAQTGQLPFMTRDVYDSCPSPSEAQQAFFMKLLEYKLEVQLMFNHPKHQAAADEGLGMTVAEFCGSA